MSSFLSLNRGKVKFAFIFTALLFSSIMFLILVILRNFEPVSLEIVIGSLLSTIIIFPIFIVALSVMDYFIKKNSRDKIIGRLNFDLLKDLHCDYYPLNLNNKWQYTHMVPMLKIDDFQLLIGYQISPGNKQLKSIALCDNNTINEERYIQLRNAFKATDMEFDFGGVTLNIKPEEIKDAEVMKDKLNVFIQTLRKEHFTPAIEALL